MSETKWTKGPWAVDEDDAPADLQNDVRNADGELLATAYRMRSDGCYGDSFHVGPQALANAHLIAAAPELYAALKDAVSQLRRNCVEVPEEWMAALRKARGEQ